MVAFNIVTDGIAAISSISIYNECYGTKLGYPNEFQPIPKPIYAFSCRNLPIYA